MVEKISQSYLNRVTSSVEKEVIEGKDEKQKGEAKVEELELKLKDGNEIIKDMVLWKCNMELGPVATPVITFNDLDSKL